MCNGSQLNARYYQVLYQHYIFVQLVCMQWFKTENAYVLSKRLCYRVINTIAGSNAVLCPPTCAAAKPVAVSWPIAS